MTLPLKCRPVPLLASLSLLLLTASLPAPTRAQTKTFQITLTDLTGVAPFADGQPFSPPVFITHDSTVHLWQSGQAASNGIRQIAEEGNRDPLVATLQPLVGSSILSLATPLTSPLPTGQSVSVFVTTDAAHPFLSSAWMLGRTNDAFSGQDSLNLFALTGTNTFNLVGMDAGTENNNEKAAYMIAFGGHLTDPENGVIHLSPGIQGTADAPLSWNWNNPVARVTITAVATVPEPGTLALCGTGLLPLLALARRRRRAPHA